MSANTVDFITYSGPISVQGYEAVCQAVEGKKSQRVVLVLDTPGGDPHAGFRIARCLQHGFDVFDALVPRYCKSAGTLILIGASTLYLDDMSELGPLDVQVKKGDELIGRNSGLDIFQAVNYLQNQSMVAFRGYLHELTRDGLSTRVASEIAGGLTSGLFEPIAAQIDPIKLAEMQRATEIAFEYGNRLDARSGNLRTMGLQKLVIGYPSHGFVIDRKEARTIFIDVKRPSGLLADLSKALLAEMQKSASAVGPVVKLYTFSIPTEATNEESPDAADGSGGTSPGEHAVDGDSSQPCTTPQADAGADAAPQGVDAGNDEGADEEPSGADGPVKVVPELSQAHA